MSVIYAQRVPELTELGGLLERARAALRISAREAARRAQISEARWRQVVRGEQVREGRVIPVRAKPRTVVAMALAVLADPRTALILAGYSVPADLDALVQDVQREMRGEQEAAPSAGPVIDLTREEHDRLTAEIARIDTSEWPEDIKLIMTEALIRRWVAFGRQRAQQRRDQGRTA